MSKGTRQRRTGGAILVIAAVMVLAACGSDSSAESTSSSTTVVVLNETPDGTTATTVVAPPSGGRKEATKALCTEIQTAGNAVADGRFVAGGLSLSRAVNTHAAQADPTVVDPARRMLRAGLDGDLDAGAVAVQAAVSACGRLGYPLDLPTDPGPGPIMCVTTPCP